jgi:hypothetical protein
MKVDGLHDSLFPSLKHKGQTQIQGQAKTEQAQDRVDLATPVRVGQMVLYVSISKSLSLDGHSFNAAPTQAPATDTAVEPSEDNPLGFDYKAVAKNVLGFVTGRIRQAQAEGGDDEKLKGMLAQAQKGIEQGFGDARKELSDMGMLSEDLGKGIDKSYAVIQDGLGKFAQELFGSATDATQVSSSVAVAQASAATRNQGSLELTTKEGDRVTLQFDDSQQWRMQQGSAQMNRKALGAYAEVGSTGQTDGAANSDKLTASSASFFYSHTASFSFSVQGDLNPDELKSIGSLVQQMGSLSDRFFSGDLQGAFDMAQQFQLDDTQLASMSLDLKQQQTVAWSGALTQTTASAAPVAQTPAENPKPSPQVAEKATVATTPAATQEVLAPLADYLQQLQEMMAQANATFEPEQQNTLSKWVVANQVGSPDPSLEAVFNNFNNFNQRMFGVLAALAS